MVGERARARPGLAVDAHDAAAVALGAAVGPRFGEAGADIDAPERRIKAGRHGPGRRAHARKLGIGRAAQPLPRRQQRHRLQQIGLARAIGAGEHDRAGPTLSVRLW